MRVDSIFERMNEEGIAHLMVTSPTSIYYLYGYEIHPGERMLVLYLNDKKEQTLFVSKLFPLEPVEGLKVVYFDDTDDYVQMLIDSVKYDGVIGVDKEWHGKFLLPFAKHFGLERLELGSFIVDEARMIKDESERDLMREASRINDLAMEKVLSLLKPGITEKWLQDQIPVIFKDLGTSALSFTPSVAFGENAAEPHHDSDETILKEGDCIIVDMGGVTDGYCSDMTRTFFCGKIDEEAEKIYKIVRDANLKAIEQVKPGVSFKSVDLAARDYIESMGYGEYFTHRTGHSIGIEVHEQPDVSSTNEMLLEEGMTFSIEPGIYILEKLGVRVEDIVLVTKDGCEVLNKLSKDLITIG